jgi:TPR repeat protein
MMKKADQIYEKAVTCLQQEPGSKVYEEGVAYLQQAARLGHAKAQYNFGIHLHQTKSDYEKAFVYFKRAAKQNHPQAHHMLGCYHSCGFLLPPSLDKALLHFRHAADLGVANAQYNAGVLLLCEKETLPEAFRYFQMAAEQKHPEAVYNVGVCYSQGIGTKPSRTKAIYYLEIAVQQKQPKAIKALEAALMNSPVKRSILPFS